MNESGAGWGGVATGKPRPSLLQLLLLFTVLLVGVNLTQSCVFRWDVRCSHTHKYFHVSKLGGATSSLPPALNWICNWSSNGGCHNHPWSHLSHDFGHLEKGTLTKMSTSRRFDTNVKVQMLLVTSSVSKPVCQAKEFKWSFKRPLTLRSSLSTANSSLSEKTFNEEEGSGSDSRERLFLFYS